MPLYAISRKKLRTTAYTQLPQLQRIPDKPEKCTKILQEFYAADADGSIGNILAGMKVAILGVGSWGTALSVLLARNGHEIVLAGRIEDHIEEINQFRENRRYLPGESLPDQIDVRDIDSIPADLAEFDFVIVAVPAAHVRSVLGRFSGSKALIFLASKGLEPESAQLLSDVAAQTCPLATVGAISGPNLAIEVIRGIPTATLCASPVESAALKVCEALNCRSFRAYYSDDLVGVELAGASKNVLAIGAGISDGLGFGDNTKGALLARGLREVALLGLKMGARIETFFGIAGVGDLFATANSKLSRNYRVGYGLGSGMALNAVLAEIGQVAEGVGTARCISILRQRFEIDLPILSAVGAILDGKLDGRAAVTQLMAREPQKEEIHI